MGRPSHPGLVDLTGTALAGCVVLERAPNVNGKGWTARVVRIRDGEVIHVS